jgi:hypothetical protein
MHPKQLANLGCMGAKTINLSIAMHPKQKFQKGVMSMTSVNGFIPGGSRNCWRAVCKSANGLAASV